MSTFRVPPRDHFTTASNVSVRDPRTSFKAKGILVLMLSFDDGWVFHKKHLRKLMTERRGALDSGLKELTEAGYVVDHGQQRGERGHYGRSNYDVYDYPHGNPLTQKLLDPEAVNAADPTGGRNLQILTDRRFVKIRNATVRAPEVSGKAIGLLATMLSFPPGWNFSEEYLQNFATDRVDSISTGLDELIAAGYVVRLEQQRKANGQFGNGNYLVADYRIGTEEDPDREKNLALITAPGKSAPVEAVPGKPAPGKSAPGKSAPGKPAPGKPAAKKTVPKNTVEKKTLSKKSSSAGPATAPRPAEPITTTQGEGKGLDPKIRATFKALLPHLLTDDRRRSRAWNDLNTEQQDAAFRRAQERKKDPHEPKAFSTVLKEELDLAAGLTHVETSTNASGARKAVEQRRIIAKQAEEKAFEAALDAGHDPETADRLAFDAYKKKLDELTATDVNISTDELTPAQPERSETEIPAPDAATGLTGAAFQLLSGKLMEIYRRDGRRLQAWSTLTPEQRDQALRRARGGKDNRPADDAFVWALVAELDAATGLKKTTRTQSAGTQKSDRLG